MWKTVFPCWKCCKAWWREHFIYLLLSQTYFKYSHCTSDKPFVNIAGLPLPKRRGMQRWQLFPESAVVYATSVSLQHIWDTTETPQPWGRVHAQEEISEKRFHQSLSLTQATEMNTTLPLDGSSTALNTVTSEALSADFDSIWTSVSVWKGGSMVKRITQNSPMRCSVTACQFFSSIHPSIVPSFACSSFHLPVCGYLCLFLPLSRQYCPSVACFPHPSPFALHQPPITASTLYLGKSVKRNTPM